MSRVNFEKSQVLAIEESLSLHSVLQRKLCHVTTPYYPIFALLSIKWLQQLLRGGCLNKRFQIIYSDLTWKRFIFLVDHIDTSGRQN